MNFAQALSYLLSLGHETLTIKLGLKNTETLLGALGDPQRLYPAVQIAGTNGKGSTAVFLDSICRAAGIRTGLFTSPHLISITERIKVNGEPILETQFARLTGVVRDVAEQLVARGELPTLPTFFEQVTAIALLAFARARVELAILETGLGGRLDSTTAVRADTVAITRIGMDHQEYLGDTIEKIAAEKAAIIREGAAALIGPQDNQAMTAILRRCEEVRVSPQLVANDERVLVSTATIDGRCRATFKTPNDIYQDVLISLRGRHQVENAAIAISMAEALRERGFAISRPSIVRGLAEATHPGRLELLPGAPAILFDGAHNPASAQALSDYLDEFVPEPVTMIFGAMRDKPLDEMAAILFPKADHLILTEIDNPRAAPVEDLKKATAENRELIHAASSVEEALRIAREITPQAGIILITGSLYLIGEAQRVLRAQSASVVQPAM